MAVLGVPSAPEIRSGGRDEEKRKARNHRMVSRAVVNAMRLELEPRAELFKRGTSNRIGYGPDAFGLREGA
jgi:hypothetical protein